MITTFSRSLALIGLMAACLCSPLLAAQDTPAPSSATLDSNAATPDATGQGTLIVEIKPFTSEKELPKRVTKQLQSGMLEWGIRDRMLVFTLVNRRFLDFPIDHSTRYGSSEQLSLAAGDYSITGVGLEMSTGFNPEKILERGAFFNENIVTFRIEPGKTTTLSINPIIRIDRTFAVNFWMPSMMAAITSGEDTTTPIALNDRNDASVPWLQYSGPLKFLAK